MGDAVNVFLAGIFGVFLGMTFLYLSIKVTGKAVAVLEARGESQESAGKKGGK